MDQLYFFKPTLNKKKVIITLSISFILLGICVFAGFILHKYKKSTNIELKTYLIDNNFDITINNSYNLQEYKSANYFLLELHSTNNLNFYVRKLENLNNYSLFMIAKNDCYSFTTNFENITELSNINHSNINSFESYNYSFKYLDTSLNTTYHMQVFFIKIKDLIYSITVDFPASDVNTYTPIVKNILSTISSSNA